MDAKREDSRTKTMTQKAHSARSEAQRATRLLPITLSALLLVFAAAGCGAGGGGGGGSTAAAGGGAGTGTPGTGTPGAGGGGAAGGGAGGEAAFTATVYPITRQYCEGCHAGAGPGFPHIAHPDAGTAYRAVVDNQKVNLMTPANSRLVLRLDPEAHFCWSDCAMDAATMEAAITDWAGQVNVGGGGGGGGAGTPGGGAGDKIISFMNTFASAVQAENQRYEADVIALWTFKEGEGDTAYDVSGVGPAMDLTLEGADWVSGGGIEILSGSATSNATDSLKLYNLLASGAGSQEYSIEAWIIPANTMQEGPARIITYSRGTGSRNFTLGQRLYNYVFRNRSTAIGIGPNGTPALETNDDDEDLQATLQHVVATFDQQTGRRIWVNGMDTGDVDQFGPGELVNWDPGHIFRIGNETTNNRLWLGQVKLVAIHNRALTPGQIQQNYLVGAADKFMLRFGLDDYLDAGSYIEFEVSEFDGYSYLFCAPTIGSTNPTGFPVEGLRVAVNAITPVASQSFTNVSANIDQAVQQISRLCSVVPKDLGSALDQFTIYFERLGSFEDVTIETPPVVPPNNDVADPLPAIGIRSFEQVNDTMAELTGVDPTTNNVQSTFLDLEQQLPASTDVRSFVSSQQVAISKLALEYCDVLVESTALRQTLFGAFEFNSPVVTAFSDQAKEDIIINALLDRMVGVGLATQPDPAALHALLDTLIGDLTAGCNAANCDAERTRTVVKATCAATLASAAVHIH